MAETEPKKLLFLGDSFTVGTDLDEGHEHEAFPFQLKGRLEAQGCGVAEPKLYAVDGHTTKHLLGALDVAEPLSNPDHPRNASTQGDYDMVVLSMGINDIFRGHTLADYKHHFNELLQRAIRFAGNNPARVMVISIPAYDASPSVYSGKGPTFRAGKYEQVRLNIAANTAYNTKAGIAAEIDAFNAAAREVIERENAQRGVHSKIGFVDITDITRQGAALPGGPDESLFSKDGIHYSGKMYARWVDRMLPAVQKMLGLRVTERKDRTQGQGT